ncbi:MAG: hypothetical protein JKY56_06275 [Kofleriaceae bacterium]|nr:hypothetical protein [Kofleriaceae bacterium]
MKSPAKSRPTSKSSAKPRANGGRTKLGVAVARPATKKKSDNRSVRSSKDPASKKKLVKANSVSKAKSASKAKPQVSKDNKKRKLKQKK